MFRQSVASVYSRWEALPLHFHLSSHYSSGQLIRADGESYCTASRPQRPVPSPSEMHTRSHQKKEKQVRSNSWRYRTKKIYKPDHLRQALHVPRLKVNFAPKGICLAAVEHKTSTEIRAQQIRLGTNFSANLVVHNSSAFLGAKKRKTAFMCLAHARASS